LLNYSKRVILLLKYLKVGQIVSTHGVKGEVKVYPMTDNIKRFDDLKYCYLERNNEYIKIEVLGVKYIKQMVVLKLSDVNDMNEAFKLKNKFIYVDRQNAVKLPEDKYFIADLIGIEVYDLNGNMLGNVASIFSLKSNDVYEIKEKSGKTFLIPAIKDVIKSIDIENNKMTIELLEGLI
jgi:16S rRNA processing protein RimM